jgi:hypothetical protein
MLKDLNNRCIIKINKLENIFKYYISIFEY